MASLREFIASIGQDAPVISLVELAENCGVQPPISLKQLMQGQCRQTVSVRLDGQPVFEGPVPFLGNLSGSGIVVEIAVPDVPFIIAVAFVKAGHSTAECSTNADATVLVPSGGTIGPAELTEIYGTSQPHLPLSFVACVSADPPQDFIFINVTFTPV